MKKIILAAMLATTMVGAVQAKPIKSLDCKLTAAATFGLSYLPGAKCNPS